MKRFFKVVGIFITLIAVGILSAFAVVALLLRQEEVKVPDFTGQDIVTAIELVTQQGLHLKVDKREPHPTILKDVVISQSPAPGSTLKKGRQVRVVLSLGSSDMQAPKIVGEHFRKADMKIRQAGFMPGLISRVSSEQIERDIVIAQAPEAGSPLDKGAAINMLVSTGKKTTPFVMPKLVGKKVEEAVAVVQRMGLQYRTSSRGGSETSAVPSRIVMQQKPAAGSPVTVDATVDIIVSK
ncbi:MAG: PASTA domain-containing protein [Nitrospirota bacterium]